MRRNIFLLALFTFLFSAGIASSATNLPVSYDLRNYNVVPKEIRNQSPYGLCWAFGVLGAVESNYLMNLSNDSNFAISDWPVSSDVHTSEFHLGYFVTKAPKGREHTVFSVTSEDKRTGKNVLVPVSQLKANGVIGGTWTKATAFLSRGYGFGPINYDTMPYITNESNFPPQTAKPEDYKPSLLRLTDVFILEYPESNDRNLVQKRQDVINDVKGLIMKHGAMYYSYTDVDDSRNSTYKTYYCSERDINRIEAQAPQKSAGHSVAVVGWDDNFPKESFDVPDREKPTINGAWLIRNSWGDENDTHDHGYFWCSYEQQATFGTFILEKADENLAYYQWDYLGRCHDVAYANSDAYAINVFKAGKTDGELREITFYTEKPGDSVDIYVNTSYGTTKPTVKTVKLGEHQDEMNYLYKGYHTYKLGTPIRITANSYFSVGIKVTMGEIGAETRMKGYSDYSRVLDGESYFSNDGIEWADGTQMMTDNESSPMNACIKAIVGPVAASQAEDYDQPDETEDDMTVDGKKILIRPEDTVNYATLYGKNSTASEIVTGRTFTFSLLSNDSQPLASGTTTELTFLYLGSDSRYDAYYDDDDTESKDYGYDEVPGKEYMKKLYPAGYDPQAYVDDEGEFFAAYTASSDYRFTANADGKITVDTSKLPTDRAGVMIPNGYYELYYTVKDANGVELVVGTLPVIRVADSSSTDDDTPEEMQLPGTKSSSGGCYAGYMGLFAAVLSAFAVKMKRR